MRSTISSGVCLALILTITLAACSPTKNPPKTATIDKTTPTQSKDGSAPSAGRIKIRWFIGVDTGKDAEAMKTTTEFVEKFNASQGKIELEVEAVTSNTHDAIDKLMSEIEAGNPPDIVAPADKGWAGEQLTGHILLLDTDLISQDLSDVDPKVLDAWRVDGKLIGLPAGVFPSTIFYNKELFDAAELPYPPHKFGELYADGEPWTVDKMEQIALQLTLDFSGRNAQETDFDPGQVAQWGYHWQWDSTRSMAVMFGAGFVVDENGNAIIPQQWREAFHWYYDGIWNKHFIPNTGQVNSLMQGNPFMSGKVAMVNTFMWYSPRLYNMANWDLAAVPEYQGKITTRMQQDGVIVLNTTQNPEEAIEVAYAIATSPELLLAWEMIPTFKGMQPPFLEELRAKHPGVDWQVMLDSINYADTTYENSMPNYRKSYDRLLAFKDLMGLDGSLSLDTAIDKLEADLQALFEEAP